MRLFQIPAGTAFLPALARGVLGMAGPEALPHATILLPTRRAARSLRDAFLDAAEGRALLLPRMRALAGLSTEDADELALPALLDLPRTVTPALRQAVLAEAVQRLPPATGGPATSAQAWALAGELATLFDEIALEEPDPELLRAADPARFTEAWLARLDALAPPEQAVHWQVTTRFLRAIATYWTGWLTEAGMLDIGLARVLALTAQTRAWAEAPPTDPIVAAGIGVGGTIPAAVALLAQVARLPQGAVVLHGFGLDTLAEHGAAIAAEPAHPLSGTARLLAALEASPRAAKPWPACASARPSARAGLLDVALRPAAAMQPWTEPRPAIWAPGLPGMELLAAPDPQAEAASVALALRGALERPGARAALVTPDRELARRVAAELTRHGIAADDSAGQELGDTQAGGFLRLLARAAAEALAPVPLLSLLKHPLAMAGLERRAFLDAVRRLETRLLRGPRPEAGLAAAHAAGDPALAELAARLDPILAPLLPQDGASRPAADLLIALCTAAEALAARPDAPGGLALYAGPEGEALATHLADLTEAFAHLPPMALADLPPLLDQALAAISLRRPRRPGDHPRVEILGLLEARLLDFDLAVLGALDETVWPLATAPGPWMSRPMRAAFGLPEPEVRIGRVAMDFCLTACAAPRVLLTRAERRGGTPTVPARWLTRLDVFLRGQGLGLATAPEAGWASLLDAPSAITPAERPAPAPPVALRPRRINVTDVGMLLADPFAFHAKAVLRLRRLDPLDADVAAIEYGTLVHAAMASFLRAAEGRVWPGPAPAAALWAAAARDALAASGPRPGLVAFWGPRLLRIGAFVVAQEDAMRAPRLLAATLAEVAGTLDLDRPGGRITLVARADRIDRLAAGGLRLIDVKTGTPPNGRALADGTAPQLPLEALIAGEGGFAGLAPAPTVSMAYWKLSGGDQPGEVLGAITRPESIAELAAAAHGGLAGLADRFLLGAAPFLARPHPGRRSRDDYDQLARRAEWEDAEDGA